MEKVRTTKIEHILHISYEEKCESVLPVDDEKSKLHNLRRGRQSRQRWVSFS
jgi:hypothetical protein